MYVTALASDRPDIKPNKILIFRSTDGGTSFPAGIPIPNIPVTFVDKPVIAVHPTNSNTLVVTFQEQDSTGTLVSSWVAVCNSASTGNLGSASNWAIIRLRASSDPNNFLKEFLSTHPLIDPVSTNSSFYWLFIVLTNDDFGGGAAGISVFKYQITNGSYTLDNGGAPVQTLFLPLGYPLWTKNNQASCTAIEEALRVTVGCSSTNKNLPKATIDYCDFNAHRMYIPTLVNTSGALPDGLTSDLFVTVWTYTGTSQTTVTTRILPQELHKYVPCAASDGHGRVWINFYAVTSAANSIHGTVDYQTAQMGAVAINRLTGAPSAIAYISNRVPEISGMFLGDYVYTQATFHPTSGGSRMTSPSLSDYVDNACAPGALEFNIGVSGWN